MNDPGKEMPGETVYAVSEAPPAAAGPAPAPTSGPDDVPLWYMAPPGGKQEGPLSLAEMKRRIAERLLLPEDLAWKAGMPAWAPARDIPELFAAQTPPPNTPPPPPKASFQQTWDKCREPLGRFASQAERVETHFAKPVLYRWIGRVSGVLAVLVLLFSVIFWPWPWTAHLTWFSGAVLLALIMLFAEGTAAVLEQLRNGGSQTETRPDLSERLK